MNVKLVSFTCAIAFFLSFFIALISGAGFGISLLRALITAICFGALSFGVDFVYEKFLKDGDSDYQAGDGSSDNQSSSNNSEQSVTPIGNKVDITIADEDLPNDDVSPRFVLTGHNQMLNQSDLSSVNDNQQNFVDVANVGDVDTIKAEDKNSSFVQEINKEENSSTVVNQQQFKPVTLATKQIDLTDEFPDIDNTLGANSILSDRITTEEEVDSFPDVANGKSVLQDDTVTDSDFASAGKAASRLSEPMFPDGSKAESKDSTLMAEAIRTILKKEE